MRLPRLAVAVVFVATLPTIVAAQADLPLDRIKLPPGFVIDVVARVDAARAMTWGDKGTLFVGTRSGQVFAVTLPAPATTGTARVRAIASGLRDPSGVAFREGALYVSAVSRILRFDDIERRLDDPPAPVVVTDRYPAMRTTAASSSPSVPTASCTCRSARRATSARRPPTATA